MPPLLRPYSDSRIYQAYLTHYCMQTKCELSLHFALREYLMKRYRHL